MTNHPQKPNGVVKLSGAHHRDFLQGLVTCDLNAITTSQASAGAFCDPKGRVLVSFIVFAKTNALYLLMPASMTSLFTKAIKKYALFSKAVIEDVSETWYWSMTPGKAQQPLFALHTNDKLCLNHPAGSIEFGTTPFAQSACDPKSWQHACIMAGFASVLPQTSGLFTPHMLNLPHFNAVSFNKGCYVGQEIIARTEHLGKLKRHLHRLRFECAAAAPEPGTSITDSNGNSLGTLVNCVTTQQHALALAVVEDRALNAESLQVNQKPVTFL